MTTAREHNAMVDWVIDLRENTDEFEVFQHELMNGFRKRFPDATPEDAKRVMEDIISRGDEDEAVRTAAYEAEKTLNRQIIELFEGLPEDTELGQAVEIRAAEGNHFAIWLKRNPEILERLIIIPAD